MLTTIVLVAGAGALGVVALLAFAARRAASPRGQLGPRASGAARAASGDIALDVGGSSAESAGDAGDAGDCGGDGGGGDGGCD